MAEAFVFIEFCNEPDADRTWPEAKAATPQLTPDIETPEACSVFIRSTKAPEAVSISVAFTSIAFFKLPDGEVSFIHLDVPESYLRICLSATDVMFVSVRPFRSPAAPADRFISAIFPESFLVTAPLVK